jgi:hypothetical protein
MTYQSHCTLPEEILEQISRQGFDGLPARLRILINAARGHAGGTRAASGGEGL